MTRLATRRVLKGAGRIGPTVDAKHGLSRRGFGAQVRRPVTGPARRATEPVMTVQQHALSDTIVACATAEGEGAIAIVRLSGAQAGAIAQALAPGPRAARELVRARLRAANGDLLDDAMLVEMPGPRSYTGEDVVELHLHGARVVVQAVLAACQALGARLAGPGEFTLRAFVNGRMDLTQAEAVGDLVGATHDAQRRAALVALAGGLSSQVLALIEPLEAVLTDWRAALDFPEYPTGEGWDAAHAGVLAGVAAQLDALLARSRVDLRRGFRVALCGAPNVGKSTLLNAWAGEHRVLVDAQPGTTRDPVEVELLDGATRWSVCDTAGMHAAASGLEAAGIALGRQWAARADYVLWLCTGEQPVWPDASLRVDAVVGGKADLLSEGGKKHVAAAAQARGLTFLGWVSGKTGTGVAALRQATLGALGDTTLSEGRLSVRQRHLEALLAARAALGRVIAAHAAGDSLDVLAYDVEEAAKWLGSIVGRDIDAAVLDRIFSAFCIGK